MRVRATTDAPPATDADTIVVGVFEDEGIAHDYPGVLQSLVDSGAARRGPRKLAVTHAEGRRYVIAGLVAKGKARAAYAEVAKHVQ
jgi:leucyl aminopeptidase